MVSRTSTAKGATLMVVGTAGFAAMGAFVKASGRTFDPWFIVFVRSLVITALIGAMVLKRRVPLRIGNAKWMAARCISGFVAMVFYFYALSEIPLATATSIQHSSPIFVALLSGRVIGERISPRMLAAVLLACVGAVLMVGPSFDTVGAGALAALASAFLAGLAYLSVRELRRTDAPEVIVFYFALFGLLMSAPALAFVEVWPSLKQWGLLLGVGGGAFVGQLAMTHAYRHGRAAFISGLSYTVIVLGAALGVLFFDEVPTRADAAGVTLIIVSGVWLAWMESASQKK